MSTSSMSLDELFHYEDSEITRRWFERTNLTPLEAISAAERVEKLEVDCNWLSAQLKDLEGQLDHKDSQISLTNTYLDNLRCRLFGDSTFKESKAFDGAFDMYEEDSPGLAELRGKYCPDLHPSAIMARVTDGEVDEVWATESNDYFSRKAIYMRVY